PGVALLAVSGGPDSIALLDLMYCCAPELRLELLVGHVDHGIAPDSRAVAAAVTRWAARYGVRFQSVALGLGAGTSETRARAARYRALRGLQRDARARYLVTAHHADDQVETVLLRVLKGSGIAGLAGIPETGPDGLTRPLLPFDRNTLGAWLSSRYPDPATHPPIHADPANADPRHDRSWLRNTVLPAVGARFGGAAPRRLLELRQHAARDRAAWSGVLRALPALDLRIEGGGVSLSRPGLASFAEPLAGCLLEAAARDAGCTLGARRAARLVAFAGRSGSGAVLPLGRGWIAEVAFDRLVVRRPPVAAPPPADWGDCPEGSVVWAGWEIRWTSEPAGTPDRASPVTWVTPGRGEVRARRTGERLRPLGGRGRRPVARLLMEARIPVGERSRYPVVARNGDVVWLPGVCRSDGAVPRAGDPALRLEARRVTPGVGDRGDPG
ncbi:MAG: tRNA lysidine(34) synthetase TilS, partial [Gemmatimonadetes bacterium]|nr:tRNA lysidine(34) synthetase TilS [Gemmatimonadota bacterium]